MIPRRFFHRESSTITAGAVILVISSLAAKVLGLVRDRIFAGLFGAGDVLDAYYAAFRIPDLLYAVIMAGALSAAFIPVFVSARNRRGAEHGWQMVNNVVGVGFVVVAVTAAVAAVLAPALINIVAPGFTGPARSLAITLMRIMMLSPVILGMSSIAAGVLQSLNRFVAYALAPVLYNVGIIIGALWFVPLWGAVGLGWGVVLGGLLHIGVQLPTVWHVGFRLRPFLRPLASGMRELGRLMVPRTVGIAAHQVNLIVVTAIASLLPSGSVTIFNFANNIHYVPIGAIGIPFATAAFPRLAAAFSQNARESFHRFVVETLREVLYVVVPIGALVIVLREPIVRLILGTGAFGPSAVRLTAAALAVFSVSMVTQAVVPLLARAFYAQHDTRTPVIVSIVSMAVNAVFAWVVVRWFAGGGHTILAFLVDGVHGVDRAILGVPVAFSAAGVVNAGVLWWLLSRRAGTAVVQERRGDMGVVVVAALLAAVVAALVARLFVVPAGSLGTLVSLVVAAGAGLLIYWIITALFGIPEASLRRLWRRVISKTAR